MFSPLEQFDVIKLFYLPILNLPFMNILVPFFLIISILLFIFLTLKFSFKLVPTKLQRFIEINFEFIFNLIKQQIGIEGYKYFPLIFTLFQFVLLLNLLSLIPFGIAFTSHIIMII
jgi:F-type H+-transporting ATPase subunit a